MYMIITLWLLLLAYSVNSAPAEDEILNMPGLQEKLLFRQYSGYLNTTSTNRVLWYWFQQSENDPENDPIIMWFPGGPGSAGGWVAAGLNGAFKIMGEGDHAYPVVYDYRWNRFANMLYFDQPAGAGFSYVVDGNLTSNDIQTGDDNYAALKHFYRKFPEFQNNKLFIFGESYGAMPAMVLGSLLAKDDDVNYVSSAAGNLLPYLNVIGRNSALYTMYYRGIIDPGVWRKLVNNCCQEKVADFLCDFRSVAGKSKQCLKLYNDAMNNMWSGIPCFNMYADCVGGAPSKFTDIVVDDKGIIDLLEASCPTTGMTVPAGLAYYMNNPEVWKALHVREDSKPWLTSVKPFLNFTDSFGDSFNKAAKMTETMLTKGRLLMLHGDFDLTGPPLMGQIFAKLMKQKAVSKYQPWTFEDENGLQQIGGYYQHYKDMSFVTIKGAGHISPQDKPREMFQLVKRYVNGLL